MPERRDLIRLTYTLSFEAAFHCGSGLPRLLLDRAVRRDAEGYLFVPGSTIKGVLRDRCEQLARLFGLAARSPHDERAALEEYRAPDLLSRLFGSRLYPGGLCFDDAVMGRDDKRFFAGPKFDKQFQSLQTSDRTQVSLSRQTGTAKPGLLFSSETGVKDLHFEGEIVGHVEDLPLDDKDPESPTYGEILLLAGLLSLDRLSGNKSTGQGRCRIEGVCLTINNQWSPAVPLWLEQLAALEDADVAWEVERG